MTTIWGIDGCRGGWLCLKFDPDAHRFTAMLLETIADLFAQNPQGFPAYIDIPIGLPDHGARACDLEARRVLGEIGRGSCVFPAPIRPVLDVEGYEDACAVRRRVEGKAMSRQAHAIMGKVREVDRALRQDPHRQGWVNEVHPELSFSRWASGPVPRKKRREGRDARRALIEARWPGEHNRVVSQLQGHGRDRWGWDDLYDAFAAAWTGVRHQKGTAEVMPTAVETDRHGIRMEILA